MFIDLVIASGDAAQSHSGVIHLFGQRFVRTGTFPAETGRLYHKLFTMRQTGDYDDTYGLTEGDVLPYVAPTKSLIEQTAALAKQLLEA